MTEKYKINYGETTMFTTTHKHMVAIYKENLTKPVEVISANEISELSKQLIELSQEKLEGLLCPETQIFPLTKKSQCLNLTGYVPSEENFSNFEKNLKQYF